MPPAPPPPPTPVPPSHSGPSTAAVDIDWDDEDEATMVFDRTQDDSTQALLRSAPPMPAAGRPAAPMPAAGAPASRTAPMPRPPMSVPPPSMPPRAPIPGPPRTAPAGTLAMPGAVMAAAPEASVDFSPGRGRAYALIAGLVAVVGIVLAVIALAPGDGSLVVTVAGPGNQPVSELEIYVDGEKRCAASPCRVGALAAGTHLVKASASGYEATADVAVKIESRDEAVYNVSLTRGSAGTGLSVKAEGRGLTLSIDGKDVGPLPQEVSDIKPGEHTVRIEGGDRYDPYEQKVSLSDGQLLSLEPKLKVKKGLATIKPGMNADGASVLLVSGNERRPVPQLPLAVEIQADKAYSIVATKDGFEKFQQKIEFEDGKAEREFVIDLVPSVQGATKAPVRRGGGARPRPRPRAVASTGKATLNINSIPASNVILDGKPLGQTPKVGLKVSPGTHTVVFVHPTHGRKAKVVSVEAGKTAGALVRF